MECAFYHYSEVQLKLKKPLKKATIDVWLVTPEQECCMYKRRKKKRLRFLRQGDYTERRTKNSGFAVPNLP